MKRLAVSVAGCLIMGGWVGAQVPSAWNIQVESPGTVYVLARQANGQIIVGGSFERVNGVPRFNLARLNADGTLDEAWDPQANSSVKAVAVSGTNIIVGGFFTNIGGQVRRRVAALNFTTGKALAGVWTQGANSEVRALAITGSAVYVGGVFTQMAGAGRARLARLDLSGNLSAAFTNGADHDVNCLTLLGTNLLVGGDFTQIGGTNRNYLLKVSGWSGAAMPWNGRPNSSVLCSSFDGTNLFIGGHFSSVNSTSRTGVARLHGVNGNLETSWDAELVSPQFVEAIASDAQSVYFAGWVTNVGGHVCAGFARVSLASGAVATTWSNHPDNDIHAIMAAGTNLLVGGLFSHIGTNWASAVARLLTNGTRDVSFPARVCDPGIVYCIATQSEERVIIGGNFYSVDGVDLTGAARFLADGSLDTGWKPGLDGVVKKIVGVGTNIYLAGTFSRLGSRDCYGLAKVSDQNGQLLAGWTNRIRGGVSSLAASPTHLYAGGLMTNVNGLTCRFLVRFQHSNNRLDAGWIPVVSNSIYAMDADATHLYVAGAFRYLHAAVSNLARIELASGAVDTSWDAHPDDSIHAVACDVSNVYVAGYFDNIGGAAISQFARVHKSGAGVADAGWDPSFYGGRVEAIHPSDEYVYAGGAFVGVGGEDCPGLARLNSRTGDADPTWMPQPDFTVYSICPRGRNVLAGGLFGNVGGMRRLAFAELEPFCVLGLAVGGDRIPVLTWRGGSNRAYAVDFIGAADYPYTEITNGLSGEGEIQTLIDAGRFNYPRLFYRVREE